MAPPAEDPEAQLVVESRPAPGVARLTLNQPQHRNALTEQLASALRQHLATLAQDGTVRALVVAGAGSAFCAGADLGRLGAGASTASAKRETLSDYYRAFLDLRDLGIPTIAAVQGPAIGAGLNLALCCDLRVVSEDARMAAPFVKLGIHPGGGATWLLTHLVGPGPAREMLLLGEPLDARRAVQLGLANKVVPRAELEESAVGWAAALAALPRGVLQNLRRTLSLAESGASFDEVLDFETESQAEALTTEDAREGWAALREHRPPRFRDR
ncbi:MAG: enoyl-CoA hydratase/isomerase family protein [Candidatus Dormibacteria bacterium]